MRKIGTLIIFTGLMILAFAGTEYTMPLNYQNTQRSFVVHLPTGYVAGSALPVVFNLHGYGSNAPQQIFYSRMDLTADANHFICVFPEGLNSSWNSGFVPPYNSYPDDVGFISKIIDTLYALYQVDLTRVYVCGMSNGGFQSYRLACDLGNRIAAIASVTGTLSSLTAANCSVSRPVPVLEIHGTNDPLVAYGGSSGYFSVEQTIDFWLMRNQCTSVSDTVLVADSDPNDSSTVQEIRYRSCGDSSEVWLFKILNGGHTWPGASINYIYGATNRDINASQEIWNFFSKFRLPEAATSTRDFRGQSAAVSLAPNPVQTMLYCSFRNLSPNLPIRLVLYDATGRMVAEQIATAPVATVDMSHQAKGVYLLAVVGKDFSVVKKVVKE